MVSFEGDEIERIERMKLLRLGIRPGDIDDMGMFERMDLLNLAEAEELYQQKRLAKLVANEYGVLMSKVQRRRR